MGKRRKKGGKNNKRHVSLCITNIRQMQRTLSLSGIDVSRKPRINSLMPSVVKGLGVSKPGKVKTVVTLPSVKDIYFYPDVDSCGRRIRFDSILEFDRYCSVNGYTVSEDAIDTLARYDTVHCCVDIHGGKGDTVIASPSYGDLYWMLN